MTYRELRSFGSYSHRAVEFTSEVEPDDSLDDVYEATKLLVKNRLDAEEARADADSRREFEESEKKWELQNINDDIKDATETLNKLKALLAKFGVEFSDIPF